MKSVGVKVCVSMTALAAIAVSNVFAKEANFQYTPLPFGEVICDTGTASGFGWNNETSSYQLVSFPTRTFIIQKLDYRDPGYASFRCNTEEKPDVINDKSVINVVACYRFNNVSNMIGWSQGWCIESYAKNSPTRVMCDAEKFQPKIGFAPGGYFYGYGRSLNTDPAKPFVRVGYTEFGKCSQARVGYKTKFKLGFKDAYYGSGK